MSRWLCVLFTLVGFLHCENPDKTTQDLQRQFIEVKHGQSIQLAEGRFELNNTLILRQSGVTLKGRGMDRTVLSFTHQNSGAQGIYVQADDVIIENLAIENPRGDGIKFSDSNNIRVRNVRVEWTNGPSENNGGYGIYPVKCWNLLIEDSVVIGAADAGFYVGQSSSVTIRRNRAQLNVAGILVENSQGVDVRQNFLVENTGGIGVFSLPRIPAPVSHRINIELNHIYANNTINFAAKGAPVANIPRGTGIMILAADDVHIHKNVILKNNTAALFIADFSLMNQPILDKTFDPYVDHLSFHDNFYSMNGKSPWPGKSDVSIELFQSHLLKLGNEIIRYPSSSK